MPITITRPLILCLALLGAPLAGFAQAASPAAPKPTFAERSARTEAVAQAYFDAYVARDWDRLEPMLDEQSRFDDATASALFGSQAKQGKSVQMKYFREAFAGIRAMRYFPGSRFASGEHMVFVGELEWSLAMPDGLVVDTRMPFVVRLQVRQGKVVEHLDTADYNHFVTALRKARQAAGKG